MKDDIWARNSIYSSDLKYNESQQIRGGGRNSRMDLDHFQAATGPLNSVDSAKSSGGFMANLNTSEFGDGPRPIT